MECNDPNNHYIHERMQLKFLVHYETECGGRFGVQTFSMEHQAAEDADLFREDGCPARVLMVSVDEDGVPHAEWVPGGSKS